MFKITIGIPAYNEQNNIGNLITDLKVQKATNILIEKVLIVSDGSNDSTVTIARKAKWGIVKVVEGRNRLGKAQRMNEIIKNTKSDILVLLDADIRIKDNNFIEKIVKPIRLGQADLTSSDIREVPQESFFAKVIAFGMNYKRQVFNTYMGGTNFFTCHGTARVFSRPLYKSIRFLESVGEDLYSYLFAIRNGFKYKFVPEAVIFYKLPETLSDHDKQSSRFFRSPKIMEDKFGKEFVVEHTKWPKFRFIIYGLKLAFKYPIYSFAYQAITLFLILKSKLNDQSSRTDLWKIASSSKNIGV